MVTDMTAKQAKYEKPPVVTYLTRVILSLNPDVLTSAKEADNDGVTTQTVRQMGQNMKNRADRVAAMMELLERLGFAFSVKKQVVTAYSNQIEAYEVKRELKNAGFIDREFQIILEYTRGWGML